MRTLLAALLLSPGLLGCGTPSTVVVCDPACPAGTHCDATGCVLDVPLATADLSAPDAGPSCSPACSGATPYCSASGQCVQCRSSGDCPPGQSCGTIGAITLCLPGCSDDSRCASDGGLSPTCCQDQCTDVTSDARNCGSCGVLCTAANATAVCEHSACRAGACNPGWADCDLAPGNGCESNLHTDPQNCTSCGLSCAFDNGIAGCSDRCYLSACNFGFDDCNGDEGDGCETAVLADVHNCGGCSAPCGAVAHARVTCQNAACALSACDAGFADCDLAYGNGCETATNTDARNCGGCGSACPMGEVCRNGACTCPQCSFANARSACVNQQCVLASCLPGFGNCDGVDKNGCEVDLATDAGNCGGCGAACPNDAPVCSGGMCVQVPGGSVLWLRADLLMANDGDPISLWPDQSGNGNDAVQAGQGRQPLFHLGVLNGQPALAFDGLDDALGIKSVTSVTDFSFFLVYRLTAGAMGQAVYYPVIFGGDLNITGQYSGIETLNGAGGNSPAILDIFAGFGNDARATLDSISAYDQWKILSSVTQGTSHNVTVRSNGVDAMMSGTGADVMMNMQLGDAVGNGWGGIGGAGSQAMGTYAARCDVAEVLVYPSALGDMDRSAVENYLNGKYQVY